MTDVHFENAGCESSAGLRLLVVGPRRLLRRLLRPMIVQLVNVLGELDARLDDRERGEWETRRELLDLRRESDAVKQALAEFSAAVERCDRARQEWEGRWERIGDRQDAVEDRVVATTGLAWDHVAAVRRIASIEDRLAGFEKALDTADDEADMLRLPSKAG